MTIDWTHFTPWASLAGGILLGVASALFILLNGRILGISGILGGLLDIGVLPFLSDPQVGQIRFILIGLALMLLVIFRPQGIFGNKREMQFNG